ncbi:NADH dehydrogenase [Desulfosarcina ovata subsp. sediminis]|uniref:NADH dehydrogenase n=1 Tax=Desulfosarcina ovata subsp. sediminis TaxID=885957 RepID=A0A5K7ZH72_9BACT|nr:NAD(P)H-dependent oxidoreductase subunit E [Desulfosarcina ovata]BBO81452.1 NADH dehydrogenase [Desulfosarcina ovata subsp. sediminis]
MDTNKIDQIIDDHQGKPSSLIHVLMEIQHVNHWLPRAVLKKVSDKLEVPFNRVLQVATFYKTFSMIPKGSHEVHVCMGTTCRMRGASKLLDKVKDVIGVEIGQTDADMKYSLENGSCLGCCSLGPEIIVNGKHHTRVKPEKAEEVFNSYA